MKYVSPALLRRRLLWPALALGGLLLLGALSVRVILADMQDTVRGPKPDTAKAGHPDSAASQPKRNIFQPGTGRLLGKVTDAETGEGVEFATVIIQGTRSGGVTDKAGTYAIINIPPGKYTVQATQIGYSTDTNKNVKILPDKWTRSYFKIKSGRFDRTEGGSIK